MRHVMVHQSIFNLVPDRFLQQGAASLCQLYDLQVGAPLNVGAPLIVGFCLSPVMFMYNVLKWVNLIVLFSCCLDIFGKNKFKVRTCYI